MQILIKTENKTISLSEEELEFAYTKIREYKPILKGLNLIELSYEKL